MMDTKHSQTDTKVASLVTSDNLNINDIKQDVKSTTQVSSSGKSGMSVVCTWMHENGLLPKKDYVFITADFLAKPFYQQKAYWLVAAPLVAHLKATQGKGFISNLILETFRRRTDYVLADRGIRGKELTGKGWRARALVAIICFFPALYYLVREKLLGIQTVMEYK
jgi:hypothetical protein